MQPRDYLASMLERVNQERATKNLPPLRMHSKLQAAAQRQANDMAANNFMGHQGSDGSKMAQRAAELVSQAGQSLRMWLPVRRM
ncbi:CAP domain [Phytophthora cactorum]|nr:CAP domain [Phytophthora cactorum]